MIKYSIHQPSVSEQTKLHKPMRPLNVLLVHQDRSFVTWFENELARIFTLRVMSNPENALTHIKNGYRPHIIIGDVSYGKTSGLDFFLMVKYLCTEGVRVIFSKKSSAKDIDLFNEQTAVHRFIKLPRPGTDIHYQLRLLIEQYIPLQRSSTSLQALLFPNGAPKRVRRGSDLLPLYDTREPRENQGTKNSSGSGESTSNKRRYVIQQHPIIRSAVETLNIKGGSRAGEALHVLHNSIDNVPDYEAVTRADNPADTMDKDEVANNADAHETTEDTVDPVPLEPFDVAAPPRREPPLRGSAPVRSIIRLLSGTPPEMNRYHVNNHAHGVADIAVALATLMSFSEEEIDTVRIAALLHDCGKYGMDERILSFTPDMLSEIDRNRYASHTERGRALLAGIEGLEYVSKIVAQHHERYDGSGFPEKLEGPQIVIEAQIINIADEYHNRVYRLPNFTRMTATTRTKETSLSSVAIEYRQAQALAMIRNQKQRFAPAVSKAFMELAFSDMCALVRPGTENKGNDPTLVNEIAKKYSAGTAPMLPSEG